MSRFPQQCLQGPHSLSFGHPFGWKTAPDLLSQCFKVLPRPVLKCTSPFTIGGQRWTSCGNNTSLGKGPFADGELARRRWGNQIVFEPRPLFI